MGSYQPTTGTVDNLFNYEEHDEVEPFWEVFCFLLFTGNVM